MKKIAISILLFILAAPAFSAEVWWTSKIKSIYPISDGTVVLRLDQDSSSCTNSNNPKYYHIQVGQGGVTEAGLDRILSTLLVAATSQMDVEMVFDTSTSACYINRVRINF